MAFLLVIAAMTPLPAAAESRAGPFAQAFPARVLAAHNAERLRVGRAPLAWDQQLGTEAATYAAQMATTGLFQHSNRKARPGLGENLWMGTQGAFTIESMVGAWASERRMFVPGVFPAVRRTGDWADVAHYTQMVWPKTERIGCALASNRKIDYLVCRYSPAGNIDGTFIQ
jgi:hypothetical protein